MFPPTPLRRQPTPTPRNHREELRGAGKGPWGSVTGWRPPTPPRSIPTHPAGWEGDLSTASRLWAGPALASSASGSEVERGDWFLGPAARFERHAEAIQTSAFRCPGSAAPPLTLTRLGSPEVGEPRHFFAKAFRVTAGMPRRQATASSGQWLRPDFSGSCAEGPGRSRGRDLSVAGQHEGSPDLLAVRSHALCRFPLPECVSAVASFRGTFQDRTRRGTVSAVIPFMQCFLRTGNKKAVYCFASLMPRNSF